MKRLLLLILLTIGINVQLYAYDITVENTTNWSIRVQIWNSKGCADPNGGDMLPAHKKDQWGTGNICTNNVRFHYPDGSTEDIVTSLFWKNFKIYQNKDGKFHAE